jgi:hypothetical protein
MRRRIKVTLSVYYSLEAVACGSGQGRSEIETAGVAAHRRGFQYSKNAGLGRKMPFPIIDLQKA